MIFKAFKSLNSPEVFSSILIRSRAVKMVVIYSVCVYICAAMFPVMIQNCIDSASRRSPGLQSALFFLGAIVFLILESLTNMYRQKNLLELNKFFERRLTLKLFIRLMRLRADLHVQDTASYNHLQNVRLVREFYLQKLPQLMVEVGGAVLYVCLMILYNPTIGLLVCLSIPLFYFTFVKYRGISELRAGRLQSTRGQRQQFMTECITNLFSIKAQSGEGLQLKKWRHLSSDFVNSLGAVIKLNQSFSIISQLLSRFLVLQVLAVGLWKIYQSELTVGQLLAIQMMAVKINSPIYLVSEMLRNYQEVYHARSNLSRFFTYPVEAAGNAIATQTEIKAGIWVGHVCYRHSSQASWVLQDIDVALPDRGMISVIGANGSGKSTFLQLIAGLRIAVSGGIYFGGSRSSPVHPRIWRKRFSFVEQKSPMITGTVREYLDQSALVTDAQIKELLNRICPPQTAVILSSSLDLSFKGTGLSMSGGQLQVLALARAILRNSQVLILDEPTSSLDQNTLALVEAQINFCAAQRLVIIATHDLRYAAKSEMIVVFQKGRVASIGDHSTLLDRCDVYRSLRQQNVLSPIPYTASRRMSE